MAAVSQALIDFANQHRPMPAPGIEIIAKPRYLAAIQPDFPIAGPNSVGWIRCASSETAEVIREARAIFASRHLPFMWTIDPDAQPPDFAEHLARNGVHPHPPGAAVESPPIKGLEIHDALADLETFRKADGAAVEAFEANMPAESPESIG